MARKIAVIDAETDPFMHGRIPEPFIWGFFDGVTYLEFDTAHELVDFLADKRYVVYAHNGGKFDYHFFLDKLEVYNEIMLINGRIAKFKIGACEFRDSINILPVALNAGGEKDEQFDYALMEKGQREKPENKAKISLYLQRDCRALYNLVVNFCKQYGSQVTQASAAIRQWQKIAGIKPPRSSADFYDEYNNFYFGGRVECFKKGCQNTAFTVLDINSAYPYAMLNPHPFSVEAFVVDGRPTEIKPTDFYEVYATANRCWPFRTDKGKLLFPDDSRPLIYKVSGHELLAGLETGCATIHEWIRYHHFEETINFSDYIQKFWLLRKQAKAEGDVAGDLFAKLFMNGLYGKWAANPSNYRRYILVDPADNFMQGEEVEYEEHPYVISGQLGPWLLAERDLEADEKRYYNIATGASITGFVRAFLWRSIHSCGIENLLYCDTDSVATREVGSKISEGNALGQWKGEGEFIHAAIAGKKLYAFERKEGTYQRHKTKQKIHDPEGRYKYASKGAFLSPDKIIRVAQGEVVRYEPDAPTFGVKRKPTFVNREIRIT